MKFKYVFSIFFLLSSFNVGAENTKTLETLLQDVKAAQSQDSKIWKEREARFLGEKNKRSSLFEAAQLELKKLQSNSKSLSRSFDANDVKLAELANDKRITMGAFGELYGVVRQVAGEVHSQVKSSLSSSQIKGRDTFLSKLSNTQNLPDLAELEKLWQMMLEEITLQSHVAQFQAPVLTRSGEEVLKTVTRVGVFNLSDGKQFLVYSPETTQIAELPKNPSSSLVSLLNSFEPTQPNAVFPVDPSRGGILSTIIQAKSWPERLKDGGLVVYVIFTILIAGVLLAIRKWLYLRQEEKSIQKQIEHLDHPKSNNPLGEMILCYNKYQKDDSLENLEVRLDEVLSKHIPKYQSGLSTLKIFASVAPLLGLLGTVTGMILTFQSITLFGTGDPKLMAGGISQALITTVCGLVCAIPLLLAHNFVSEKSKSLNSLLEEKLSGLLARKTESGELS